MRNVGLLAFGVTSLVLVPAVLHELTAGPQQIAKLVEPGASSLVIGDATIDVSTDRALVDPGAPVHVTLRATAPKAEKVTASVLVLEQLGTYNGRVPQPPNRVMLETVTLDAAPGGGAAKELAIKLPGNRNVDQMQLAQYAILVMPPRSAEKLDKLRRGAKREGNAPGFEPMESPSPRHGAYNEFYYRLFNPADDEEERTPARAARLDVMTRPRTSAVAIRAPERAVVGEEITVVVQVTNPTKRRIPELSVQLQQPEIYRDDYRGLDFAHVSLSTESASLALGPRETKQVEFHLTANQAGTLGLWASISCSECEYDERLNDGNLEAIDITPAPRPAPPGAPIAAAH